MKPKFITKYTCKYHCKGDAVLIAEDKTLWYTDLKGLHSANDTLNIESCELLVKQGRWTAWFPVTTQYKRKNGYLYNKTYWVKR